MGNINAVPVVSQTKSLVQVISGDQPGALATQIDFSRQCPIVSQVNSAIQAAMGDMEEAKKIQEEDFVNSMENLVDAVPVIGHVKGAVHYGLDQHEEGSKCMKAASRSTGTLLGGLVGSVGGPGGAVAGGILGGTLTDSITTAVDTAVHDKYRPSGIIQGVTSLVNDDAKSTPGAAFDLVAQVGFDALSGYGAGTNFGEMNAPGLPLSKPPSVVEEQTKVLMRAMVYRKKDGASDEIFSFIDPFEVDASKQFMHNMAGQYIRETVLGAIQKTYIEEILIAKTSLEEAKKEGKDLEKAEATVNKFTKQKLRYEVQLMCEDPSKQLALPFKHMGWGDKFEEETKYNARFPEVRIAISIEPSSEGSETHSVMMLYAYPLDGYNNILTWKQVAKESARIGTTHVFDLDVGQTSNITQDAPTSVTFTKNSILNKIEGNTVATKKPEQEGWKESDQFGMWISDTCFAYGDKCYKKEDYSDWAEERPPKPDEKEEKEKKEEREKNEGKEKIEEKVKNVKNEEKEPLMEATAAM